jgi:beta-glucosidase
MGWEIYPEGFGCMLRRLADAGLPIIVTENGIATADDAQRIRYLAAHLQQVKDALSDGVDVRGYMYWSSFDNFEWAHGYTPTFGLIGIDRDGGYRRVARPSAAAYAALARTGQLTSLTAAVGKPPV